MRLYEDILSDANDFDQETCMEPTNVSKKGVLYIVIHADGAKILMN